MKYLILLVLLITCPQTPLYATKYGSVKIWDGTNYVEVTPDGALLVSVDGHSDTLNSTVTPLDAGDTFVGSIVNVCETAVILISTYSDQASDIDGLIVEFSTDSINFDNSDVYTIAATTGKTFSFQPAAKYYRVRYVNGAVNQTEFRLQILLKKTYVKSSSHRVGDNVSGEDDAELVKSVLSGEDEDGVFQNVQTTRDGNLSISDNSSGLAIARGLVTGVTYVHKFGSAPDFDFADGAITVWDGADDGASWENMVYDYSTTADIQYLTSSDNADVQTIQIQGLDSDYNLVTQTKTLTGQTSVAIDTPLIRVFRMKNSNSVDLAGHVFLSTTTAIASGVPLAIDIRCIIQPENNQTEMAIYTVPAGKTAYVRSWYSSSAGAKRATNIIIRLRARALDGVWQLKHKMAWSGDIPYQHKYDEPQAFGEKTDIEITAELAASTTDAAVSAGFDIVLVDN